MEALSPPNNYIFSVTLVGTSHPTVTRLLSVPADITFHYLHAVLQAAFNWTAVGEYSFEVMDRAARGPNGKRIIHLVLNTLASVANIDQNPLPHGKQAAKFRLKTCFEDPLVKGKNVEYVYDKWCHRIEVVSRPAGISRNKGRNNGEEKVANDASAGATENDEKQKIPLQKKCLCLAGEGHAVAEQVGGPEEWAALKAAYAADDPTEEEDQLMDWYEDVCVNGNDNGIKAYRWDIKEVNRKILLLEMVAKK